jgi:hypothetical protein
MLVTNVVTTREATTKKERRKSGEGELNWQRGNSQKRVAERRKDRTAARQNSGTAERR